MPINLGGRRFAANRKKSVNEKSENDFPWAEEDQMYGRVEKMLGSSRLTVFCSDKSQRLGTIRGSMRKRTWINVGDIVLVSLRRFDEADEEGGAREDPVGQSTLCKVDVIHKYSEGNARYLRRMGELKELEAVGDTEDPDLYIEFDEDVNVDTI